MTPVRCPSTTYFDKGNDDSFHVLIDTRHLAAINYGRQAVSQFGHGKYSVAVHIWPRDSLIESFTGAEVTNARTESAIGLIKCKYVIPTKARYAALHHLKSLEKQNNMVASSSDNFDGESHPLLVADVDTDDPMAPGSGTGQTMSGGKGAKVIRFGFDDTVQVYGQDSFVVDLDKDGNVTDAHEFKLYNLLNDGNNHFGILPRYEASINPVWNESGDTTVNLEWDKPLSMYKAYGVTQQIQQFGFNWIPGQPLPDSGAATIARFSNIEALGGLIKLEISDFTSVSTGSFFNFLDDATDNDDFEMYVTVTEHSWTPMKR